MSGQPDDTALLTEIATQLDHWARESWARMTADSPRSVHVRDHRQRHDAHGHHLKQIRAQAQQQRELAARLWLLIGQRAGDAPVGETAGGAR